MSERVWAVFECRERVEITDPELIADIGGDEHRVGDWALAQTLRIENQSRNAGGNLEVLRWHFEREQTPLVKA